MKISGASPANKLTLELSIEFVFALIAFLGPYGAQEMGLPHNFGMGLGCWIIGWAIIIRAFWIFPWSRRFSRLEKGLIAFIATAVITTIFYRPILRAYGKRDGAPVPVPITKASPAGPTPQKEVPATEPATKPPNASTKHKSHARQSATGQQPATPRPNVRAQNCPNGVCIGGDNFGNPTVNNFAPPVPKIIWSQSTVSPLPKAALPGVPPKPTRPEIEVSIELQGSFVNPAFTFLCSVPCVPIRQVTLSEEGDSASNFGTSVTTYQAHGDRRAILLVYGSPARMLARTRLEVTFMSLDEQDISILDVQPYTAPQ